MVGFPKHDLPPVQKQVERCVRAARLQLARLREQREQEAAAEIPPASGATIQVSSLAPGLASHTARGEYPASRR
jgi:hypothetical protein